MLPSLQSSSAQKLPPFDLSGRRIFPHLFHNPFVDYNLMSILGYIYATFDSDAVVSHNQYHLLSRPSLLSTISLASSRIREWATLL